MSDPTRRAVIHALDRGTPIGLPGGWTVRVWDHGGDCFTARLWPPGLDPARDGYAWMVEVARIVPNPNAVGPGYPDPPAGMLEAVQVVLKPNGGHLRPVAAHTGRGT